MVFAVTERGIGKPDYSREVSSSKERSGMSLKYNQSLVVFVLLTTNRVVHPYAIPWVKDQIAIGGEAHLINVATGLPMPYIVPQGYTINMIQKSSTGSQDYEIFLYYESGGVYYLVVDPGIMSAGQFVYANMVVPYSTATLDPTAASSHGIDLIVANRGGAVADINVTVVALLEKIGSPPLPTTKDCRCPFCSHIQTVPVGTTIIVCVKCGSTYLVQDLSGVREF